MLRTGTTCVADHTRAKRTRILGPLSFKRQRRIDVSATHLYHYMMRDTLVDWLKLDRVKTGRTRHGGFTEFIMERGNEFESELVKYINDNIVPVISVSNTITTESLRRTKELMFKGIPIIHSAPVKNQYNGTQGIIDLLVRSDYLSDLVDSDPLSEVEKTIPAPKLQRQYHYIVVDIKFSTLPLRADGIHLLNSGSYPAYKAQCLIYTNAVGHIQGYNAPHAFIMGRRWRYTKEGITNQNFTCLNRLGRIQYDSVDADYKLRTKEAIQWVRDVKKYGSGWTANPPSRVELYPNMCIDSGEWNAEKERLAKEIGEITNIWYVSEKHRNTAIKNGVNSWRDARCNTSVMKLRGMRAPIIDAIMSINRQNEDKIRPKKIGNNIHGWKNRSNELFVDFETLSDIFADFNDLPRQDCTDMIFMIGVGWCENKQFRYKNFICKEPTHEEEYRIMNEFGQFIAGRGYPKMYYWVAENRFWNTASCRQFDRADREKDIALKDHISDDWKVYNWIDLADVFRQEPIVLKDCFKFGLKTIASAMRKHGMISATIDSACDNGMTAMVNAWEVYRTEPEPESSEIMKDIAKYNEFDCKVLWEILTYLRENHS